MFKHSINQLKNHVWLKVPRPNWYEPYPYMHFSSYQLFQTLLLASNDSIKEKLRTENDKLKLEIDELKKQMLANENLPRSPELLQSSEQKESALPATREETSVKPTKSKNKENKVSTKASASAISDNEPVDVSRLDFRIGHILEVEKHPDADSLYVEKINVGEDKPRTVVSGLVRHMLPAALQGKMVVLLCNLKPAKMRGITSEAMVMCASTPEKVEVLSPPEGCIPGDVIEFEGYSRNPDAVLNPKKKIFESCAPDLRTNADLIATYKGVPFAVPGKGVVKAHSLANVLIK